MKAVGVEPGGGLWVNMALDYSTANRQDAKRSAVINFVDGVSKGLFLHLSHFLPMASALFFLPIAKKNGVRISIQRSFCDVIVDSRVVRVSHRHQIYLKDVARAFDFYFSAVKPAVVDGMEVVDYSEPRFHDVIGYPLHPIWFSSLAEPIQTTQQYIDFAQLKEGDVVLDLGAYSGLTSILFDQKVGERGAVVAVDADKLNIECTRKNLALYREATGRTIRAVYGAMWSSAGELAFSSEGNMGSSVSGLTARARGEVEKVNAYTLAGLADELQLDRVDFIKCDIEGAEAVIFDQPDFFRRFRPRIIIEAHMLNGVLTTQACLRVLETFGYKCREVSQLGSALPLVECVPSP